MLTFLQPVFLWIAGAAVVPLFLHLFQKNRIRTHPFSSVMLLRQAQKRSVGKARLRHFLLWLVRTLLLLLIAAAFAAPVLRTKHLASLMPDARRDLAIVWDVSFSMTYAAGGQDTWAKSKQTIRDLIDGLKPEDRVCIFLADEDVTALVAQPTDDHGLVLERVNAQTCQNGSSRIGPAVDVALTTLADADGHDSELVIVSDGQAVPWAGALDSSHQSAQRGPLMYIALLGANAPRNMAVKNVSLATTALEPNTPTHLSVDLLTTAEPLATVLHLWIDGREIRKQHVTPREVQANGARLMVPGLTPGVHAARVSISADPVAVDNSFFFLLRCQARPVLLCVGNDHDTRFLRRALAPTPELAAGEVRTAEPAMLDAEQLRRTACVFLCNAFPLPGQAVQGIEQYVREGGILVVFPGDRATVGDYQSWEGLPARVDRVALAPGSPERMPLRINAPDAELLKGFRLPPGSAPHLAAGQMLELAPAKEATTLLTAGGCPFLTVGILGQGHVLLCAVAADRTWSDFPVSPLFLPVLHQICHFAANRNKPPDSYCINEVVPLPIRGDADDCTVETPNGRKQRPRMWQEGDQTRLVVDQVTTPGIYSWQNGGEPTSEPVFAVNVPCRESNLAPVDTRELLQCPRFRETLVATSRDELLRTVTANRTARSLAEPFLWLVLGLSAVELTAANLLGRRAASTDSRVRIDDTGRVEIG